MEKIFIGHGIEIFKEGQKFFLLYDAGEISDRMEKIEISKEEVIEAQKGSMEAYNIIIKYQNKAMFNE